MPSSFYIIIALFIMTAVTFGLRLAPFVLFSTKGKTPELIQYLGKVMPPAMIAMLIVYSVRHINLLHFPSGIAELIALSAVVLLHLWRRQYILSIIGGTVVYMICLKLI